MNYIKYVTSLPAARQAKAARAILSSRELSVADSLTLRVIRFASK